MFNTSDEICTLCHQLAKATNKSPSTISRLASGSGHTLKRLADGKDITIGRAQRISQYLSDNWPDNLAWPKGISRPKPSMKARRT